jgi:fatty acid desaturase
MTREHTPSGKSEIASIIRESIKDDLPEWSQPFFTWLTAKPFYGQKPWKRSPMSHVYTASGGLILGVLTTGIAVTDLSLSPLVLLGWSLTIYGSRKLRLTIQHAAAHNAITGKPCIDYWIGELISIVTLTSAFDQYKRKHIHTHHTSSLLKPGDETYEALKELGLKPGVSPKENWRQLRQTMLSPRFYTKQILKRLAKTFFSPSVRHNLLAFVFWSIIIALVTLTNAWVTFGIAWIMPISIFFEISSILRKCVEHRFPVPATEKRTTRVLSEMTAAIFLGEKTPDLPLSTSFGTRFMAWSIWWLKILCYHLPVRLLVLVGDSTCHDAHHRHPNSPEWANYIFVRNADIEAGCSGWREPYWEAWGLLNAIGAVLESIAQQQPISVENLSC